MQAASDIYLGWTKGVQADRYYYWRQLRDMKASALVDTMTAAVLEFYAGLCGWTLARAHARSGDRVAIAAYLGRNTRFDDAMADYAVAYADKTGTDYERVCAAADEGRLTVPTG
jgi:sugar/nucleoside kinase (ribokinase family)